MKQILGSIFLFFSIIANTLYADENRYCSYSIKSSKNDVYVNEPLYITFHTRQKITTEVMFFDLKPLKSSKYKIVSIEEKRHEFNYHDAEKTFTYLVFAKESGSFDVEFEFQIRRASDDAVAQAYTGSRDNVKSIPTTKVKLGTVSVAINAKNTKEDVDALGNFKLSMSIDKTKSNSYDAINVKYTLSGTGYLDENYEPIKDIPETSIFRSKKQLESKATKDGYIYNKVWSYAIVSKDDFKIPPAVLRVFDFKKNSYIKISTDSKNISITPLDSKNLIDSKDSPESKIDLEASVDMLYNMLIFIAGFLFAKLLEYMPKKDDKKNEISYSIKNAKTAQDLLKAALHLNNKYNLQNEVKELEEIIYSKSKKSHKDIKAKILSKLS